jgi:hypothetical protein
MAPLAILGILLFVTIGGAVVMQLWNWLLPPLFGFRQITFWQAFGLLALCRILFGSHGFGRGGARHRMSDRVTARMAERMGERWDKMTPEEQERARGNDGADGLVPPVLSNAAAERYAWSGIAP